MSCGHVILADSHANMLQGIRRLLEARARSVVLVADEPSLLEAIHRMQPDLVIADFSFQVCGETNVVRLIKRHHPATKVIVVSVYDDPTAVQEAADAGAEGFVLKRRAVVDLIPAVDQVRQGRPYVSRNGFSINEENST